MHADIRALFVPECPIIFPDRIDYAEWVSVDAMDYGKSFEDDLKWFLDIVETPTAYHEIISQAADHLVELVESVGPNPVFRLDKLLGELVIPLMLERLTSRRILLWLFRDYGEIDVVGRRLSYKPGKDKQWPGLRTLMSRCGLQLSDLQSPQDSSDVMPVERQWLANA